MNGNKTEGSALSLVLDKALGHCPAVRGLFRKAGVSHWLFQRVTALALIPVGVWFAAKILSIVGAGHAAALKALGSGFSVLMLVILIPVAVAHMGLGVESVIDDYVHDERARRLSLKVLRYTNLTLIVGGFLAVLRIALKS